MTETIADRESKADDWAEVSELESLDPVQFAAQFPVFRTALIYDPKEGEARYEHENYREELESLIIKRISEPPTQISLCTILSTPVTSTEDYYWLCSVGCMIGKISAEQFEPFRSSVRALSESDASLAPDSVSMISIQSHAKEMLYFMDNQDKAWVATRKSDSMFERSLSERVHSEEEMKPYVDDLLGWLADVNWPPRQACIKQLARFPEATIDPVIKNLTVGSNDLEWHQRVIEFAEEYIPKGPMWERLAPVIEAQIKLDAANENEQLLSEAAESWMKEWNQ